MVGVWIDGRVDGWVVQWEDAWTEGRTVNGWVRGGWMGVDGLVDTQWVN